MEQESKEGRENGGESDTKDTNEGENTQTADKEVAEKCGVERDTENGVTRNVADEIKTDACQGPEETTPEEPSGTVPSKNGNAQPTAEPESQEDTSGMKTKADEEVKKPYEEAQNATEDKNIAQGKTDHTNASYSEVLEQPEPVSNQADPGTDQGETSKTEQYEDGVSPQTPADSPTELEGKKAIKEPSKKTPDAPTAQSIKRNNMEDSSSNGTQEALSGSGAEGQREAVQTSDGHSVTSPSTSVQPTTTGSDPLTDNRKSSPSGGIPDSKLEKLAKALPGEEYRNARSLGQNLGFNRTKLYGYCGYGGKPKDSSGILRMLRDWKEKTHDEKQLSGLLEALNKANLKHLAGDLRSQEGAEEQREAVQTSDGDSVTSPSKSVQPTTTGSDPLTDNRKSSPSVESVAGPGTDTHGSPGNYSGQTDKEEKGDPQKTDSSSKPKGTNSTKVVPVAGPGTATKGAPGTYSGQTDKEEKGDPQKSDSSSKPNGTNSKKVESVAGPDTATKGASGNYSGQTDKEEKGDPQKIDSSSKPKGTNSTKVEPVAGPGTATKGAPVLPGAGLGPLAEGATRERSGKTDQGKEREPQKNDSSTKPNKTNPKTESEEEKRATENGAQGAAATVDGTKQDGTTKKKAKEEVVEAGGTELQAEDADESFENVSKERPVSISVCTSAYDFNVKGLVYFLTDLMKDHPELIKEVKVHALPYNDLDHYTFPKDHPVDVMLLCHSINNRRFAITDVMDALYDEYLPYCARVVGKNKMGVIVHDFEDMRETVQSSRMGSFKYKQPKAFETTSLQIICGHIEKEEKVLNQMLKADREKLPEFLKNASTFPEEMMNQMTEKQGLKQKAKDRIVTFGNQVSSYCESKWESITSIGRSQDSPSEGSSVDPSETERNDHGLQGKGTSGGSHQALQTRRDELNLNSPRVAPRIGQQMTGTSNALAAAHIQGSHGQQSMASGMNVTSAPQISSSRRISISVCSSAYDHNVKGFMSKLTELQAGQPLMTDIHFRSLPYNDIDSFMFPSKDPVDVMVLCHSVQNRGFSITNVMNALYEKYLQYCHDVIGKKKLAVIVHDFSDCKSKTLDVRMESFKRSQPLTFELVDTVIVCGNLEKPGKIEMRDEDITRLTTFFKQARYEQRENYAVKQSFYEKSFLGRLW